LDRPDPGRAEPLLDLRPIPGDGDHHVVRVEVLACHALDVLGGDGADPFDVAVDLGVVQAVELELDDLAGDAVGALEAAGNPRAR